MPSPRWDVDGLSIKPYRNPFYGNSLEYQRPFLQWGYTGKGF
ncbi:hypothetical protein D3OALGA1CA_3003 [Olavius algarvensis associated proteobacterium Delta 3]|nr:hypothetical protein D3OALGA1CA_3003 [Olavius algarvensis associated proteobacterium Delta 3]